MSGITATSLLVPRPILSALPQSAEKGIEGQGQVDPAAPTPPIETPPPQINQGTIVAIIEFAGGAVAAITAEEIEREIQSPEQLNRTDLIQLRYKLFTEKIGKLKEGKTVTAFEILDPDMKFLYALNVLLSQDLGEEMLAKFEAQLLPVKTPDKPYLIMLFAFILYGNGKIKIEKAEELVKKAVASGPELTEIYFNAYRFFAAANKFDQAYYYLINGLRAGCKLPLDKNPAPKNALVDFGLLSECVPMEMLLEVPAFLLLESEFDLQNKKYDSALGWIEITIKITGKTPFPNEKQKAIFFADLELKKAKILMAQEEYMDAYKSLESAVKVYDEAAEKNPENAGLQLRLASIFLALLQINKFLPGYQPYLRYHLGRCIPSMKAALKSAEKTAKEDVSMLFDISQLYVSMGETADAIRIMEKLVSLAPKNTQYAMQLGDLYLSGGDIDKAFENYEKALAIAGEDPMLTANLHIRFAFIQTQAETNLVRIRAGKPNIAQSLLNFGVTALLTYFNPSYLLSQTIGKLTGAIFNKKYSEEEWDKINKKAVDLESRSFYRTAELIKQQNRPDVFFYIVEAVFTQSASLLKQASEMKEKSVTNPEEIEGIKEIAAALKQQAGYIIEGTFKKSFIKKLGTDFEKAKAAKSTEEMLKIVSLYFDLFFFITDKIGDKNAPPALVDALELVRGMVFEEGIKRIGEIRTLAEDTLDLNLGMDLFQLSSRIMDALVKKKEGSKDRKIKRAEEAVREEVLETLAVNIKVATANRNLPALMEFGKAIRFFGPFSYKAWEEALKLAEGNREKLVEIGGILVSLWEEESQDLVQELGNKESLKKLATITYQKIRDLSSGEERLVACRQLWVLGDYESAYLGYVATIDEFKAQKDPAKLANLFYELAHISEARGNHELKKEPRNKKPHLKTSWKY
ncbi:MAG: tetratricopeptide repeat protein [Candidatus Saganbacteria bacterium]|nr:tetratricopeptide repeat protein [Candidatus Saganbacteria bacterium]